MKVNRMSLALAAFPFGQRAAIDSKLAGFGRSFRADIHPMVGYSWVVGTVGKNLACEY